MTAPDGAGNPDRRGADLHLAVAVGPAVQAAQLAALLESIVERRHEDLVAQVQRIEWSNVLIPVLSLVRAMVTCELDAPAEEGTAALAARVHAAMADIFLVPVQIYETVIGWASGTTGDDVLPSTPRDLFALAAMTVVAELTSALTSLERQQLVMEAVQVNA